MEEDLQVRQRQKSAGANLRLRRERELRGWSQANLAEKIGAQPQQVVRWEAGKSLPSPYYRQRLCVLFEKNAEELGLLKREEEEVFAEEPAHQRSTSESTEEAPPSQEAGDNLEVPPEPLGYMNSAREEGVEDKGGEESFVQEPALPITQTTIEEQANLQKIQQPAGLSRRTIFAGLLGGALAVGVGGFWWEKNALSYKAPLPTRPGLSTEYIYRPDPAVYINFVAWSPHGSLIACTAGDQTVKLLEAATGTIRYVYRAHTGFTYCVDWAPDEMRLASTSADKTVQIWEPLTGENLLTYRGHSDAVFCVAWSHDGNRIASSGRDKTVQIWDPLTGKLLTTYRKHTQSVWNIIWSPDGTRIASCGLDGSIHMWDPSNGKDNTGFVYQGPAGVVTEITWSPDGSRIVSTHVDKTVRIWDVSTGFQIVVYKGHTATPDTARWSPDNALIASGGYDNTVQIWTADAGKHLFTYNKHKNEVIEVSWAPDGKQVATASKDETLQVFRVPR